MAYRQEACLLRNCCVALRYLHFADHTFQGPLIHQHHYPESHRLVSRVAPLCNGVSFKSTGLLFSWVCSSPILQVILRRTRCTVIASPAVSPAVGGTKQSLKG